jgi:hypothetical protein
MVYKVSKEDGEAANCVWSHADKYAERDGLILICKCAQLDVTIYRFILAIKNLYIFRAFLAHPQEWFSCIFSSWYNKLENRHLNQLLDQKNIIFYTRYVDDLFLIYNTDRTKRSWLRCLFSSFLYKLLNMQDDHSWGWARNARNM